MDLTTYREEFDIGEIYDFDELIAQRLNIYSPAIYEHTASETLKWLEAYTNKYYLSLKKRMPHAYIKELESNQSSWQSYYSSTKKMLDKSVFVNTSQIAEDITLRSRLEKTKIKLIRERLIFLQSINEGNNPFTI